MPGARPGDDVLTCDEIYAQGRAESQRDQQEREQKQQRMKAEQMGTAALVTSAIATGGASAPIAQKAAEANADKMMAMLAAPQQVNPRLARLKQLWAQKQCVMKSGVGNDSSCHRRSCLPGPPPWRSRLPLYRRRNERSLATPP